MVLRSGRDRSESPGQMGLADNVRFVVRQAGDGAGAGIETAADADAGMLEKHRLDFNSPDEKSRGLEFLDGGLPLRDRGCCRTLEQPLALFQLSFRT